MGSTKSCAVAFRLLWAPHVLGSEMNDTTSAGHDTETIAVVELARATLDLSRTTFPEEYYYHSLPLCVVDAIFSINARYRAVQNVIARYCSYFGLPRLRQPRDRLPPIEEQESVSSFCGKYAERSAEAFAVQIFQNRQRTSTRNGILKAEAVWRFAEVLRTCRVEFLQDIPVAMANTALSAAVRAIPGQGSGISLDYFWMLAGAEDGVKPDRMILRFVERAIGHRATPSEAQSLISRAAEGLSQEYTHLTARFLDYLVWQYESSNRRIGA